MMVPVAVVEGCLDESACNYNSEANTDDESCEYAEQYYDCDGVCLLDSDGDGVCDELEVLGCTDSRPLTLSQVLRMMMVRVFQL